MKEYTRMLQRIFLRVKTSKEQKEVFDGFVRFVLLNNDGRLLKKILVRFEDEFCRLNGITRVELEYGPSSDLGNFISRIQELVTKKNRPLHIREKENSNLISGVRVFLDSKYLVDASFRGFLRKLI